MRARKNKQQSDQQHQVEDKSSGEEDSGDEDDYDFEIDDAENETESESDDELNDSEGISSDEGHEVWKFERKFENKNDLDEFLKLEKCWAFRSSYSSTNGKKTLYRCNLVTRKGPQCDAELYTMHHIESKESDSSEGNGDHENVDQYYMLYRKKALHTHQSLSNKTTKLSEETKQKIIEYYNDDKKPVAISYKFRSMPKREQPTIRQIKSVIENFKQQEYGKHPITMRQLQDFVNKYTELPEDIDQSFIVMFERSPPDEKEQYFRFFISTPRLLTMAANAKNIHADSTHKVTTEKIPLIVIGATDAHRTFHLIGITVTSHEKAADYEMSFNAVKLGVQKVTGLEFKPNALICDADPAIHNGFKKAFDDEIIIIMCYAHVMSNVHRKYKFKDNNNRKLLENDLRVLHKCYDEYTFEIASQLFMEKWTLKENDVAKRIEKSFFDKNKNWYIGCCKNVPKTNNSLERFNGLLKQQQLNHQKKPLKKFKKTALRIVRERSNEYKMDKTPFQQEIDISTELKRKGMQHKKKLRTWNRKSKR